MITPDLGDPSPVLRTLDEGWVRGGDCSVSSPCRESGWTEGSPVVPRGRGGNKLFELCVFPFRRGAGDLFRPRKSVGGAT